MLNSTVVEIAIGLVLLYLVLGLVCTSVNEYIAQLLGLRAENLVEAIYGMFTGPDRHILAEDIYDHPEIRSLCRKQFGLDVVNGRVGEIDKLPSSIPPSTFSAALTDLLRQDDAKAKPADVVRPTQVRPEGDKADVQGEASPKDEKADPNGKAISEDDRADRYSEATLVPMRRILRDAEQILEVDRVKAEATGVPAPIDDKFDRARPAIEEWYEQVVARAGGWYKRRTQVMSFMVAAGLVLLLNADTISMYKRLANSPVERAKLDALTSEVKRTASPAAQATATDPARGTISVTATPEPSSGDIEVSETLKSASFDFLGWASPSSADPRRFPTKPADWLIKVLGLAITAFAVSLGAPFWFDVLSKFMTVRSGGDPNRKSADKASAKAAATVEVTP